MKQEIQEAIREIDNCYNTQICEYLNKAVIAATDGDLHLEFDINNRKVLILTRISQVKASVPMADIISPVEFMYKVIRAVKDNLH